MRKLLAALIVILSATKSQASISLDGSGTAIGTTTATSVSLAISSGSVTVGDRLEVHLATRCEKTGYPTKWIPPLGWVLATPPNVDGCDSTSDIGLYSFVRFADDADVARPTYTFTAISGAANALQAGMIDGIIAAWKGVPNNKYWYDDEQGTEISSASRTLTAMPVADAASSSDAHQVCYAYVTSKGTGNSTPSGYTAETVVVANTSATPALFLSCYYLLAPMWSKGYTPTVSCSEYPGVCSSIVSGIGKSVSESETMLPSGVEPYGVTEQPYQVGNRAQPPADPPVSGTTYYVDNSIGGYNGSQAPTGKCAAHDASSGQSWANAWCTIAHLNGQSLLPGTKVVLACGDVWHEQLNLNAFQNGNGTSRSVLTFGTHNTPCSYREPALSKIGLISGNLPIIDGADEIGPNGGSDRLITTAWTACGAPGPCPHEPSKEFYIHIGRTYSSIDGVFVTDVPTRAGGPGMPNAAARIHPYGGLARATDLSSCSNCESAPGLAVAIHTGSFNGGNDFDGSGEIEKMRPGSWLYVPADDSANIGSPIAVTAASRAGGILTLTVGSTYRRFDTRSPHLFTMAAIAGLTPSACNGIHEVIRATATTILFPAPSGCSGSISLNSATVLASAPPDVMSGYLYVWLGDSSNPNNHTVEVSVRNYGIGGEPARLWIPFSHGSFTTVRGLNIVHTATGIGGTASSHRISTGIRYFRSEWTTIGSGSDGVVDTNVSYNNQVRMLHGSNVVLQHSTIWGAWDHGDSNVMQNQDFGMVQYDDHAYSNHDGNDTKSCDAFINRYNKIHDTWTEPGYRNPYSNSPSGVQGTYVESVARSNRRASWSSSSTLAFYYTWGFYLYYNAYFNIDPYTGGGLGGGAAIHSGATSDGVQIINNSIHMSGRTNDGLSGGCIYIEGKISGQVAHVYNNVCDNLSPVSSSFVVSRSDAGTNTEAYNNWGTKTDGAAPTMMNYAQSRHDRTSKPVFVNAIGSDFRPPCASVNGLLGSSQKGLAHYAGAFAPLACNGPTEAAQSRSQ